MDCLSCRGDYEREGAKEGNVIWSESNIYQLKYVKLLFLIFNPNDYLIQTDFIMMKLFQKIYHETSDLFFIHSNK